MSTTSTNAGSLDKLTEPWVGPYGGLPPWDQVNSNDFLAAFDQAISEAQADVSAIANNPEPPTFENTIEALDRAGRKLDRVGALFGVHASNLNISPIPDIQRVIEPKLAEHSDWIIQNPALFERIQAVFEAVEAGLATLSPAATRLTHNRHRSFVRNGAGLDDQARQRVAEINQRVALLFTEFNQNILFDQAEQVTWVQDKAQLDGLSDAFINSLAQSAAEKGRPGVWAISNTRSFVEPVLAAATDRALREQVWHVFYGRGDGAPYGSPDHDNKALISELLTLRLERAKILGFSTFAHWQLEESMAATPEAAMALMESVWPKARARALEEVAEMQAFADSAASSDASPSIRIEPWDYRFYAEKVRKERFDLDMDEVKAYLQLDKLTEAMMWSSGELYGLQYTLLTHSGGTETEQIPVFHEDVSVFEVSNAAGEHVGLWYLDPYARDGKSAGAWMTAYRSQENMGEAVTPLVSNNSNFVKGAPGEPVLISWSDARTLFHEFGHALHGLLSDVEFRSLAGTSVSADYVEFPSQINEHWLSTREVLNRFCLHYETGEPMPASLIDKITEADTFNSGFDTVEYLSCALVDMKLHLLGELPDNIDPAALETELLDELGMPPQVVMRHRLPHFAHIFATDHYSAGYYSYMWADALTADAAEAFTEAGGFFDKEVATRLYDNVLSKGDSIDPRDGFRAFRGRDVDTDALLRKRGFPVS